MLQLFDDLCRGESAAGHPDLRRQSRVLHRFHRVGATNNLQICLEQVASVEKLQVEQCGQRRPYSGIKHNEQRKEETSPKRIGEAFAHLIAKAERQPDDHRRISQDE